MASFSRLGVWPIRSCDDRLDHTPGHGFVNVIMESQIITELARQGVLGILLALLIYAFYRKDKALAEAYQKRVDDNNRLATVIEATNTASRALELTSENRSRVIETIGEATRASTDAIKTQSTILDQVRRYTESNGDKIALLREDLEQLRQELLADRPPVGRTSKGGVRR